MDFLYTSPERLVMVNYVAEKAAAAVDIARRAVDDEDDKKGSSIGLGWLLAIALCGGVLLFVALGYLLVWWLKMRSQPITTRVYAHDHPQPSVQYEIEMMGHNKMGGGFGGHVGGGGGCGGDGRGGGIGGAESLGGTTLFEAPTSESATTVLAKKKFLRSESSMGRLSARFGSSSLALWQPPSLPSLPVYESFRHGRNMSRNWVNEGDVEHGPKMQRSSWRNSWLAIMMLGDGQSPTLPQVGNAESQVPEEQLQQQPQQQQQYQEDRAHGRDYDWEAGPSRPEPTHQPNELNVKKKRQSRPPLLTSQSAPELARDEETGEPTRGRSRVAGYVQYEMQQQQQQQSRSRGNSRGNPYGAEPDLKDILRSTEQRLRDGTSCSPVKTPQSSRTKGSSGSPSKGSPTKTPRSCRSGSTNRNGGRMTPSPSKKSAHNGTPTTAKTNSRNGSVTSIGSAANSLIRAATEQLELPDGSSSPSRLRAGQEWSQPQDSPQQYKRQAQQQQQQQQQQQRRRSRSLESDSSALSTLYSVGEPEEDDTRNDLWPVVQQRGNDPFVESKIPRPPPMSHQAANWESRQAPTGPRPLRRTKTIGSGTSPVESVDETAVPAPLRTISVNSHMGRAGRQGEKRNNGRQPLVLSPPKMTPSEEVRPKVAPATTGPRQGSLPSTTSTVSMLTDSSYTDVTVSDETSEEDTTPKADGLPKHKRTGSTVSSAAATPTRKNGKSLDLSSSPLNEREVISMLTESSQQQQYQRRHHLPMPPSAITLNGEPMPSGLSPRPESRNQHRPTRYRRASVDSLASSIYDSASEYTDQPGELMPPRRTTLSGLSAFRANAATSVGNTVAELRRMNSIVSSYSVASVASSIVGGEDASDSAVLPSLRGGGFSPSRSNSKNEAAGKRNYLNFGTPPAKEKKNHKKSRSQDACSSSSVLAEGSGSPGKQQRRHKKSNSTSSHTRSGIPVRAEKKSSTEGKENDHQQQPQQQQQQPQQQQPQRTVRFEMPTESRHREGRRSAYLNLGPPSPTRNSPRGAAKMMTPEQRQLQRGSVESIGLYDKDGFLKSSPDREAVAKGGRLRM